MGLLAKTEGGQPPGARTQKSAPLEEPRAGSRDAQFAEWFRLFLAAVSHEVGNSLQTFRLMAHLRKGEGGGLVQAMVDDYNKLRILGTFASKPADSELSSDLARLFPEFLPDAKDLDDDVRLKMVRCLALLTIRSLRGSLDDAAQFRDTAAARADLLFHYNRVMEYGGLLCDSMERLVSGDFDFDSECEAKRALGRGSVLRESVIACREAGLRPRVSGIDGALRDATVVSNPLFLRLILVNICSNAKRAIESARGEERLALSVARIDGAVRFRFSDSGCGMDAETMEKLNSGVQTSTKGEAGHGIGFSYCRGLAEKLGGRLYIESSGPGKGTDVVLELRVAGNPG